MQAIADELFQEMQCKQDAKVTEAAGDSPQFSLVKEASSLAPSDVSDMTADETLDSLHDRPPVQALQMSTDARWLSEVRYLAASSACSAL